MALDSESNIFLDDEDLLGLAVTTDKKDYAPGATAILTVSGLEAGATVTLEVDHVSDAGSDGIYGTEDDVIAELGGDGHDAWTVTDGGEGDLDGLANGVIVTNWYVNPDDSLNETFRVTASQVDAGADGVIGTADDTTTQLAYASFTDSVFDLTTNDAEATINGALFTTSPPESSAGTGVIQSFVRVQANGSEEGFNTSARPVSADETTSLQFTHDLLLSDVPIVEIEGVLYYEFLLDINETNSQPLLSLDQLQVYVSDTASLTSLGGANTTLVYDLDTPEVDNTIYLNYALESGSGASDMFFYVPVDDFDVLENTYVYLFSEFGATGGEYASDAGFEEWAVRKAFDSIYSISGYKWDDTDGDGIWDAGETGLGGWTIIVQMDLDRDGIFDPATETVQVVTNADDTVDANGDGVANAQDVGYWEIPVMVFKAANGGQDLSYTVRVYEEMQLDGDDNPLWINTYGGADTDGTYTEVTIPYEKHNNTSLSGALPEGEYGTAEPLNFGNTQFGSIEGVKYEDAAGDGAGGTDTPYAGWTVYLFDASLVGDGNATLSPAELQAIIDAIPSYTGATGYLDSATTDGSGHYIFEGLAPGDYFVIEDTSDSGWTASTTAWHYIDLQPGETYGAVGGETEGDADFYNFELFDISGTKYTDENGDGETDGDEGLGGVTIFIDLDENGSFDWTDGGALNGVWDEGEGDRWTVTAGDGTWSFEDLDASYDGLMVYEVLPDGYVQTLGELGYEIEGTSGNDQDGLDFANFELASIEGYKFWDLNRDGIWGVEECGAEGWTILLFLDDGNGTFGEEDGDPIQTTMSDEDGLWTFEGLLPGTYFIKEQLEDGYVQTTPEPGGDGVFKVVVDASGEVVLQDVDDNDLLFGNDRETEPGERTPGFWMGPLGRTYWDGDPTNDGIIDGTGNDGEKQGGEFAENDVIWLWHEGNVPDPGLIDSLLIGDWNGNHMTDGAEVTLELTFAEALAALEGGDGPRGKGWDKTELISRDLVASWLNVMAGNTPDDEFDGHSVDYWIDQAILYINNIDPGDKQAWSKGVDSDGVDGRDTESGSAIHAALDAWNNSGETDGGFGDTLSVIDQSYMDCLLEHETLV